MNTIYCYFLICACLSFTSVFSIKCFQCNSAVNPECADLTKNDTSSPYFKECTESYGGNEPFCRKTTHTIITQKHDVKIHRSCGWISKRPKQDVCKNGDTDFIHEKNCQCFSDGCNSSSKFTLNMFVLLFSSCTVYLFNVLMN